MSDHLQLDVLRAAYGDCLILRYKKGAITRHVLFDGGPTSCWEDALEPHLESLHDTFEDRDGQLVFELGICSHIDRDHIKGLVRLTDRLVDETRPGSRPFVRFKEFWHNNLRNMLALDASNAHTAALASIGDANVANFDVRDDISRAVLASYSEGNDLRRNLSNLRVRPPFVSLEDPPQARAGGLKITVLAPSRARAEALREEWKVEAPEAAALAASLDKSIPNLASIVTLLEFEKKTLLMTGDAVWTDVVEGLKQHGHPVDGSGLLDVLKLPHHGSNRNVRAEFFAQVPAGIYVISADGHHNNPDADTLDMLVEGRDRSRPGETFTIVMADDLTRGSQAGRQAVEQRLRALEDRGCTISRPTAGEVRQTVELL